MKLYRILKKPIQSEKTTKISTSNNVYTFVVSSDATKIDIKKAVFDLYWLEVSSVNVLNLKEKFKQWKKFVQFKRRPLKKAYVTLKDKWVKLDYTILSKQK